ncbi:MAG: hypothetical protein J6Y94_09230, partial [Bacteriovoracaceae bacterium]|nr:hypothetical protein [Bacteriovoracaceae bacterium]
MGKRKFCWCLGWIVLLAGAQGQELPGNNPWASVFGDFWDSEKVVLAHEFGQEKFEHGQRGQRYRAFLMEGQKLYDYCANSPPITYARPWEYEQAVRSVVATLQYIGLDVTTSALVAYAQYFAFNEDEFNNLATYLVEGSCSPNLTVVGKKQLQQTLQRKFSLGAAMPLPRLVPQSVERVARSYEFEATQNLFRAFCSWGLDIYDLRLLGPVVANSAVMAYIFRNMEGKKLTWDQGVGRAYLSKNPKAVQVGCEQLICRRQDARRFKSNFPRAIGTTSLDDDVKRLYCANFIHQKWPAQHKIAAVAEVLAQGPAAGYLMSTQFLSLLTEEGDRTVQQGPQVNAGDVIFQGLAQLWQGWAEHELKKQAVSLRYEENFVIEGRPREAYFNPEEAKFRVEFSFNYGEFDRATEHVGKLGVEQKFPLPLAYLEWAGRVWRNTDPEDKAAREKIQKNMAEQIRLDWKSVDKEYAFFQLTPELIDYLAEELIIQAALYRGKPLAKVWKKKFYPVVVKFYVAPFALKALAAQYADRQLDWSRIPFQKPLYLGNQRATPAET